MKKMTMNSDEVTNRDEALQKLHLLAKKATHRWEWRSLNSEYEQIYSPPDNSIDFLKKNSNIQFQSFESMLMGIAPALTELLWQELALLELLEFYYIHDELEGDHFGPVGLELDGTPAGYLLSPGYSVDWVNKIDHVDYGYVADLVEEEWESWEEEPLQAVGALAIGVSTGHLEPITQQTFDEIFFDSGYHAHEEFIETDVEILPEKIKAKIAEQGITYTELEDSRKMELVKNLIETIEHPFFGGFKISQHLLSLLHLHPATPAEAKVLIKLIDLK
jgi:hypothetical protein